MERAAARDEEGGVADAERGAEGDEEGEVVDEAGPSDFEEGDPEGLHPGAEALAGEAQGCEGLEEVVLGVEAGVLPDVEAGERDTGLLFLWRFGHRSSIMGCGSRVYPPPMSAF